MRPLVTVVVQGGVAEVVSVIDLDTGQELEFEAVIDDRDVPKHDADDEEEPAA